MLIIPQAHVKIASTNHTEILNIPIAIDQLDIADVIANPYFLIASKMPHHTIATSFLINLFLESVFYLGHADKQAVIKLLIFLDIRLGC